jgi:hypothetical protein
MHEHTTPVGVRYFEDRWPRDQSPCLATIRRSTLGGEQRTVALTPGLLVAGPASPTLLLRRGRRASFGSRFARAS